MDWFVKRFLQSALVWLGLGVTTGVAMAVHPQWVLYRPAHVHMSLLGFVTMMIYGVAYHVVPRFFGAPLRNRGLAGAHWWLSNTGLALMVFGFILLPHVAARGTPVLASGGVLSTAGAFIFIFNIWRTMNGSKTIRPVAPVPASRRPPVLDSQS